MKEFIIKGKWLWFTLAAAVVFNNGCALPTVTDDGGGMQGNGEPMVNTESMYRLEPLHGFVANPGEIEFSVTSTGCTNEEDFSIETEIEGGECTLAIYRIRPDRCRRAPKTVSFKMKWDLQGKCAATAVRVRNTVSAGMPTSGKPVYK